MVWKWHQKMPVTWYTFKWHPTCQTPCQDYPVLQDSKVRLKGHNESWQCSVCLNGLKLSGPIQNTFLSTLKTILMVSGTILSSKTPGSDFEDIGSLDGLFAVQSWWNLQYWFRIHFLANLYQFQWSQEPSVLQDSRVRLRGHRESWWTFCYPKLMKLTVLVQDTFLANLYQFQWSFCHPKLMKLAVMVHYTFLSILTPMSWF